MKKFGRLFSVCVAACLALVMTGCPKVDVDPVEAEVPTITTQPADAVYNVGGTANPLMIKASVSDGGTLSYQWYKNGDEISGAISKIYKLDTSKETIDIYYCVVTNTLDSSKKSIESEYVTITVQNDTSTATVNAAAPSITASQLSNATYTAGTSAGALSVSANVSDGGTLSYQWYKNGSAISNAIYSSYTPDVSTAGSATYYCVVTNTNNSVNGTKTAITTSASATITVTAATVVNAQVPSITSQPESKNYTVGESASALSVSASVSDGGTLSYQWYKDNSAISNATTLSYTPDVSTAGSATYYCVVTNTNNSVNGTKTASVTSGTATITVSASGTTNAVNPTFSVQPVSATYTSGATSVTPLYVTANASDGGTVTYQWYKNGSVINDANTFMYTPVIDSVSATTYILYTCVATNTNSSATGSKTATATSNPAVITINPVAIVNAAAPSITASQLSNATYTAGTSAGALSVSASVSDGGTLSYQWYKNGSAISNAIYSSYTPDVSTAGSATYYCVVTNTNNSVNGTKTAITTSASATITVTTKIVATTPVITTDLSSTSSSGSLSIIATGNGTITYQLYKDGSASGSAQSSGSFTVTESGTYYIIATNTYDGSTASTKSTECTVTLETSGSGGISIQF